LSKYCHFVFRSVLSLCLIFCIFTLSYTLHCHSAFYSILSLLPLCIITPSYTLHCHSPLYSTLSLRLIFYIVAPLYTLHYYSDLYFLCHSSLYSSLSFRLILYIVTLPYALHCHSASYFALLLRHTLCIDIPPYVLFVVHTQFQIFTPLKYFEFANFKVIRHAQFVLYA
jgi:hypothetical protein